VITPPPTQNPDIPQPDEDEVDEPTIPSTPVGEYVIPINNFTNTNDWDRGVFRSKPGVSIPGGAEHQQLLKKGRKVRLADNSVRTVNWPQAVGEHISLFFDGEQLDASKVGAPNAITVLLDDNESIPTDQPDNEEDATEVTEPSPTPSPLPAEGDLPLAGMNLAGMGNNPWFDAINGPDGTRSGTHYRCPVEKTLAPYVKDLNGKPWLGRLVISGERLVTNTDTLSFSDKYLGEIRAALDLVHKYKGRVLIDMHNYFRWWKKVSAPVTGRDCKVYNNHLGKGTALWTVIGEPDCPITDDKLARIWQDLAKRLKDHPAVLMYGLMNEPHNRPQDGVNINEKWPPAAQKCIDAIRQVDKDHYITVGGNFYSSAKLWPKVSTALANLNDPANKLLFEAHQYMDRGGDGGGQWLSHTDPVVVDRGIIDWAGWFKWLKDNNLKGLAGEFGGPATAGELLNATDKLMDAFIQHRIPFTQWLSGEGFSDNYANGMNKADGTLKPNSAPLMKRLGATCAAYGPGN
jgi:endoglucanase